MKLYTTQRIENMNGLIQKYVPKRTEFDTLSRGCVRGVEELVNDGRQRCLG